MGSGIKGSLPLYRFGNQRFGPIRASVSLYSRFGHQRFGPIIGSGIRGSVTLEVRELEVRALEVLSRQRLGNQRFGPIRGSGIIGSGISDSVGVPIIILLLLLFKKVTVSGGLISSQNSIGRLLISSLPLKGHKTQEKVNCFCRFLLFKILDEFFMGIAVL